MALRGAPRTVLQRAAQTPAFSPVPADQPLAGLGQPPRRCCAGLVLPVWCEGPSLGEPLLAYGPSRHGGRAFRVLRRSSASVLQER